MADTSAAGGESKGVEETTGAPLGLMTQLLKAVQEEDFDTAVRLCGQVLALEPGNATAKEYLIVLQQMKDLRAAEAKEEEAGEEGEDAGEEDEDEDGEEEDEDEDEDSDEEDDEDDGAAAAAGGDLDATAQPKE